MLSNQKKVEKYTLQSIKEAGYEIASYQPERGTGQMEIQVGLDKQHIKVLTMMEEGASVTSYIQVLNQIEETKDYFTTCTLENTRTIQDICYAEIGRHMVQVKQKDIIKDFKRCNIYLREYMLPVVVEVVKKRAESNPDSVFIFPNQYKAVNFHPQCPPPLQDYIESFCYEKIIRKVNKVIQEHIFMNNFCSSKAKNYFLLPIVLFSIVLMLITMTVYSQASLNLMIVTGLCIAISFILILSSSLDTYGQSKEEISVSKSICISIEEYFYYLNRQNNHVLQWVIGQDFFWIQIKINKQGLATYLKHRENAIKNSPRSQANLPNRIRIRIPPLSPTRINKLFSKKSKRKFYT